MAKREGNSTGLLPTPHLSDLGLTPCPGFVICVRSLEWLSVWQNGHICTVIIRTVISSCLAWKQGKGVAVSHSDKYFLDMRWWSWPSKKKLLTCLCKAVQFCWGYIAVSIFHSFSHLMSWSSTVECCGWIGKISTVLCMHGYTCFICTSVSNTNLHVFIAQYWHLICKLLRLQSFCGRVTYFE